MEVTAELKEKIDKLSPEKLVQFERYVDFLLEEVKQKDRIDNKSGNRFIKDINEKG